MSYVVNLAIVELIIYFPGNRRNELRRASQAENLYSEQSSLVVCRRSHKNDKLEITMVNISRYFLASAHNICNQGTNRDETYEAMKQTIKTSLEYKRAIYVKNLYKQLKKDRIGTTTIETMSGKLCSTLPKHRQRTLVKVIVNWKLQDAHKELRERKSANTEMWRKQKPVLDAAGITTDYKRLWRREVTII